MLLKDTWNLSLFQVSWPGLCSLHPRHPGADSFSSILQGSSVLPASLHLHRITRCHTSSTKETPLPQYHRRPGGLLPNAHPSHLLWHGHQRTEEPAQGRGREGKRGEAERKGEEKGEGKGRRNRRGEGKQLGGGQREGGGDGSRSGEVGDEFRIKWKGWMQ